MINKQIFLLPIYVLFGILLVLDELRSRNTWEDKARDVIIEEMKHIGVKFHF